MKKYTTRLLREIQKMETHLSGHSHITVRPLNGNLYNWVGFFIGENETPYTEGKFHFVVKLSK